MRGVKGLVAALGMILVGASVAHAQRATAHPVAGVALDTTGAVLQNATVVLTTTSGGAVQETTTDAIGHFRFDAVPRDAMSCTSRSKASSRPRRG